MQIFPTTLARWLARNIDNASVLYLQQFTQAPPRFAAITIDTSPFSYTAKEPGFVIIQSGTVSAIHLIRGADDLNLTGQVVVPVSINDTVTTTYSVLPTMIFVPIYGAAQR
jgi:hypothetical protein